jgi:transposase-like protein
MLTTDREPIPHSKASGEKNKTEIRRLYDSGLNGRPIARQLDLNESYVYRVIREYLAEKAEEKSA